MLESLRSVEQFLDDNAEKLASVVNTGTRQRLTAAIADLSTHASEQTGSNLAAQGATQKKEALRLALLRDHMAPIARIAAADIPNLPELSPLRMPRGKPTAEKLASYAYGMGAAATPFADTFTKAGLSADFVAQLSAAADAVVGVVANRTTSQASGAAPRTDSKPGSQRDARSCTSSMHSSRARSRTTPPFSATGTWSSASPRPRPAGPPPRRQRRRLRRQRRPRRHPLFR